MMLSQAANMMHGELSGNDVAFSAVSKDSRSISEGDLYVALVGEHFDGHEFVEQACRAGATGAVVSKNQPVDLPQIKVADTRIALGELAAGWRQSFQGKMIAVTGSNGKTTVKEMCRCVLQAHTDENAVLSTAGNLNNDIGVPMTLLSLQEHHHYAVIEMGANHVGEIAYLTNIARPDVAIITNAGPAHLEGFGSVKNVAQAKAEIYSGLSEAGTAVINLDDEYAGYWLELCDHNKRMTFSMMNSSADIYVEHSVSNDLQGFNLHTPDGEAELHLKVPGEHSVMNALAAIAATLVLGVSLDSILKALSNFEGVSGRLMIKQAISGSRIIDDTYNANPASLKAAIDVMISMGGEAWLVLGDMGELGEDEKALHVEAGRMAKHAGVSKLFATGASSGNAVEAFGDGAAFYSDRDALIKELQESGSANNIILIKGSRFMKMEEIVMALVAPASVSNREMN